ncbi:MAG TPA: FliA/WhiG family RNA polymerase sigma factor [Alphaproteobacteria bacterium]|nr:FliA/WhiG family RNA polymerase sigma factor [Alphaproteobacteria bacterium]
MNSARPWEGSTTDQLQDLNKDQLISEMLPQVRYIARRVYERLPQHVPFDDLVQAGTVGLLDAVEKFDPTKNAQLKTYAKFRIRGAILDSLRDYDWAPRDLRRQARRVEDAQSKLRNSAGRTPGDDEVAQEMGLSLKQYYDLLGSLNGLTLGSLEGGSNQEDEQDELCTYVPYAPELDPFFLCARGEMKEILTTALGELPQRERDVLVFYYYEELTLKEVGAILGVVESRVSQLRSSALVRLRAKMQDLLGTGLVTLPAAASTELAAGMGR